MPRPTPKDLDLTNIAGGVLPERFSRAVKEVVENIRDPNMKEGVNRKITIEITFDPRDDGAGLPREGMVTLDVKTKLAGRKPAGGFVYFTRDGHRALTNDVRQDELFDEGDDAAHGDESVASLEKHRGRRKAEGDEG